MPDSRIIPKSSIKQISPGAAGMAELRKFLGALRSTDMDTLSDNELLSLLQKGGLIPAPLLGRKVAVSGSACESYEVDENGMPLLGLGDAVAEAMLLHGADTVLNSKSETMDGDRLSDLQQHYGRRCGYVSTDMSTEQGGAILSARRLIFWEAWIHSC